MRAYTEDEDALAWLEAGHIYCMPGHGKGLYQCADIEGDVVGEVVEERLVKDNKICQTAAKSCLLKVL